MAAEQNINYSILWRAEAIYSKDGYLNRRVLCEATSTINEKLLVVARYGELRIDPGGDTFFPQLKDPQTWDRKLFTIASIYDLTSYSKVKIEYYFLDEVTGDKKSLVKMRRDHQPSVKDNQFLIQLELNF